MNENTQPPPSQGQQPVYPPPYGYYPPEDEINLLDLWKVLVERKRLIFVITMLSTLIAIAVALLMTPIYRAEALLAPVSEEEGNKMGALASQFGGLASLAGINIGGGGGGTEEAIAILKSRDFTNQFIKDMGLMPVLFDDQWDAATKQWRNPEEPPTAWDAFKLFDAMRSVSTAKDSGLVTLAIEWRNPEQAAEWVSQLINRINNKLRNQAIIEADSSIAYLEKELEQTNVVEVKQSFYSLIEAQTKNKMLANTRDEYAFKVIDQPVVPEEKIKPKRKLIVVLGFILGGMLSIFLVLFINFIKNQSIKE